MKKKFKLGTVWAVWAYFVLFFLLLILQAVGTVLIPMEMAIYSLMMIVGSYIGLDQAATFVSSMRMPEGIKYEGSKEKLRNIAVAMVLVLAEGLIVQYIIKPRILPLDQLFFATGLILSIYVGGNKAANIAAHISPKKEEVKPEASSN